MSNVRFPWINHKYACDVLEEMRKCNTSRNYGPLESLIEQLQIMVQAMEDAIGHKNDIQDLVKAKKNARKLIKKYRSEVGKKKPDMKKVEKTLEEMRGL